MWLPFYRCSPKLCIMFKSICLIKIRMYWWIQIILIEKTINIKPRRIYPNNKILGFAEKCSFFSINYKQTSQNPNHSPCYLNIYFLKKVWKRTFNKIAISFKKFLCSIIKINFWLCTFILCIWWKFLILLMLE